MVWSLSKVFRKPKLNVKDMAMVLIGTWLFMAGLTYITPKVLNFFLKINIDLPARWGLLPAYPGYVMILAALILVAYKFIDRKKFSFYGIKKITKIDWKLTLGFFALLWPIALIARLVDPSFDVWYASMQGLTIWKMVLLFNLSMPLYVIKEEIIERGLIQPKLSKAYGSLLTAIMVSVNFGIIHYMVGIRLLHSLSVAISVAFGSMVLVGLYEKTKNLWTTIITHLVYNCVIVLQIYWHATGNSVAETAFWIVYGVFFVFTIKYTYQAYRSIVKPISFRDTSFFDWVFMVFFAAALPLILLFL